MDREEPAAACRWPDKVMLVGRQSLARYWPDRTGHDGSVIAIGFDVTLLTGSLLICVASFLVGLVGALTGLGGGAIIVPLLVLVFRIDLRYAAGASLVSVIATSSGAAAAYVRDGISNVRIGMFLEIATTLGALLGAFLATSI